MTVNFNEKFHYHGDPCVKCGSDVRYMSNNCCVACQRKGYKRRREADPQKEHERIKKWRQETNYDAKWREANREKLREIQTRWANNNPDKIKQSRDIWYKNNPDYSSQWYEENKDQVLENVKAWKENNRQKVREMARTRRARKRANLGSFTIEEWTTLCEKYDNKCLCCGKKRKLQADHIIPVTKGGSSFIYNIAPLCKKCNLAKHVQIIDYRPEEDVPDEFKEELERILKELE